MSPFYRWTGEAWEASHNGTAWHLSDILADYDYDEGAKAIGRCPWAEIVAMPPEVDRIDWQRDDSVLITVIRASNEEVTVRRSPKGVLTIMLLPSDEPLTGDEITAIERAAEDAYQNYDPSPRGESA